MTFFSYGTLMDAEYQRELFGHELATRSAYVRDWQAVFTPSGFLTIVPRTGAIAHGALIVADETALAICDAWEEVPLYVRVPLTAFRDDDGSAVATWAYVRHVDDGEAAEPGVLARASRAEILAAIRRFRSEGGGHTGGA